MFSTKYDEKTRLWYGPDIPPLFNPSISIAQVMLNSMSIFGSKIAQISDDSGIQMTFDEMRMKTIRAAQNLQAQGFNEKQLLGIMARNSHHVAPIFFASIANGSPIVALDASFGNTEIIHMLSITKPVLMFCDIECYDILSKCLAELGNQAKVFTFGGQKGQSDPVENLFEETHKEHEFIPIKVDGQNEIAFIVCSSGTTGFPKGVCLSHASVLDLITRSNVINCHDKMLCFSSLFWISGCIYLLLGIFYGATRVITKQSFSPELQLRIIEKYRITYTFNATHHLALVTKCDQFHKTDLSSWRISFVVGSKVSFHLKTELMERIPNGMIIVAYGMSETAGTVSNDYPPIYDKDTVGRLSGCCIKIVDENGNRCGVNVDGEICIKTNYKCLGYYGNQQATDEFFDADGFIQTGDIGHFDVDGDLFIVDRKKELLKYCGFQISPSQIDAFLTESPDIKSACVVGIPDAEMVTDLPAAVIVRAEGSNITEQHVYDMVADHFADHYKLRGGVYFVDSLPTTHSGKIQRRKVQEIAFKIFKSNKH